MKIEEGFLDNEIYHQIKMVILQSTKLISAKSKLPNGSKFKCNQPKCTDGWFDENPKPSSNIYGLEFQMFNKDEEKKKNLADFECQVCKAKFDNPNKDSQNSQTVLVRC